MLSLDLPISFSYIYDETLFNFSDIQLEQQIHFLHDPFFIHPAMQNASLSSNKSFLNKMIVWYFKHKKMLPSSMVSFN